MWSTKLPRLLEGHVGVEMCFTILLSNMNTCRYLKISDVHRLDKINCYILLAASNKICRCVQCTYPGIRLNIRAMMTPATMAMSWYPRRPASTNGTTFFAGPYRRLFNSMFLVYEGWITPVVHDSLSEAEVLGAADKQGFTAFHGLHAFQCVVL